MATLKCKKRLAMKTLRDGVKGGVSPAQLVAADVIDMSQQPRTPGAGGRQKPQIPPLGKRMPRVEGGSCNVVELS